MLYFNCVVAIRVLFLFPHGVVDWSEVCDCGFSGLTRFFSASTMV